VADHLCSDLRVENLAGRAGMSPRNFARVFAKEAGITPARFIEKIRVESGRRRLEESRDDLEKIARDCGLGSVQGLRRSFCACSGLHLVNTDDVSPTRLDVPASQNLNRIKERNKPEWTEESFCDSRQYWVLLPG
jgi:hypothetical protein